MPQFAPGDRVHIAGLGTGIVRAARNSGHYVIEIKGGTMVVPGSQLEGVAPERGSRKKKHDAAGIGEPGPDRATSGSASLDLHGRTVLEAIEALDAFLNDAFLDGRDEVHVIHGRGGGRLKTAVHQRLAQLSSLRGFRLDPGNPGVTIVSL
jgi:DNA mismatch repair protein MutS2